MLSSPPTCLFNKPEATKAMTCLSRRVSVSERPYLRLATKCGLAALDGVSDGTQQHVIAEWLRQELDSARLHGLDGHRYVTVTRNEDDRHVDPIILARSDAIHWS